MKVAAAPISWGVCEVPNWGHQLAPARVLGEAERLGFSAIEAGPPGFLPDDPAAAAALLARHGLRCVGGFVTAVLHTDAPELDAVRRAARWLGTAGAEVLVLAASGGRSDYDEPGAKRRRRSRETELSYETVVELADAEWARLFASLDAVEQIAAREGLALAVHPHVGTVIERREAVERFLDGCDQPLCLDTGHLFIGGADPAKVARDAGARVRHVHLKDVDAALAALVRERRLGYAEAVRRGLYRPLGKGDARIAEVVTALAGYDRGTERSDVVAGRGGAGRRRSYDGWAVLEQDVALVDAAADPAAWVGESLAFLGARV